MNTAITSASFLATALPGAATIRTENYLYVVQEQPALPYVGASRLFAFLFGTQETLQQRHQQPILPPPNEPDYFSSYE
ncbi:MAG: hypothetical protein ACK4E8_05140 [Lacibacter sp.]|jgi:hypothetical protein